jgi:uncharacterized hydrophobic protein (TIGR00271 family)
MANPEEEFLGELRLGRQLTSAGQVAARGVVALIGLLVLLANQSINLLGRLTPLASFLIAIVLGLTLLNVVELLGGSRERGGTYILVQETLGGIIAFLTGWSIFAGCIALLVALAHVFVNLLLNTFPAIAFLTPNIATLAFIGILIFVQLFQILPRRQLMRAVALFLVAALAVILLAALPHFSIAVYRSKQGGGLGQLDYVMAWLSVTYVAFEALLASRRQVHDPGRHMQPAIFGTLVFGSLFYTIIFLVLIGLRLSAASEGNILVDSLLSASLLPGWLVVFTAGLALIAAANICMMTAIRQIHALSREGAFPQMLRRVWRPIPLPVGLFALLAALAAPLALLTQATWLVNAAAVLFLLVTTVLNISTIYSHSTEPERRRPFVVPFPPLVPAMAIFVNIVLLRALPVSSLLSVVVWLALGIAVYAVYSRYHQVEAQEGEIVFGRLQQHAAKRSEYRILVPIGPLDEREIILRMALALAKQLHGEVIPLQVIPVPDPLAIEEGRRTARERNTLFQWSTRLEEDIGVPLHPITRLARSVSDGIIDTAVEENCDLILMSWPLRREGQEIRSGSVLRMVAPRSPSDVAVVAYHPGEVRERMKPAPAEPAGNGKAETEEPPAEEFGFYPTRILVPTSGGPHAPLAIQLALLLAHQYDATVTAIYVADADASDEEIDQGKQRIQQTIAVMREQAAELPSTDGKGKPFDQIPVEGRIVRSSSVVSGIAEAGQEYDLVLMGASEESLIDQVLFGNIPEQVATESSTPVVIVKHYRGLPRLWLTRTWNALYEALPTLTQEEQIEVYRTIHRDARPDVDFFVMIGLSALIATFGLLQNSAAVIIGAMLVAPLFSPLLGISLAIIQGNIRLLRLAIEATLKGVFLAIGLATLLALMAPFKTLTPQITSRSLPNLFDLAVAIASGAAGAYAIAREDVAAALPGVAIAAALVPPLGVIGIGLAMGDLSIAGGGTLLVATNLIAIALAGAVTFLLLGFRPGARGTREAHLRRGLATAIVLFLFITIPLGIFFVRSASSSRTSQVIQNTVVQDLGKVPGVELVNPDNIEIQNQDGKVVVTVPLYAQGSVSKSLANSLSNDLSQAIHKPVVVRLVTYPLVESSP